MTTYTVYSQSALEQVIRHNHNITIVLEGDSFVLPKADKLFGISLVGSRPLTKLYLTGTMGYSYAKRVDPANENVNQFLASGAIDSVSNLVVTSKENIELTFENWDEASGWEGAVIDKTRVKVTCIEEKIEYLMRRGADSSPAERFIEDVLDELLDLSQKSRFF